jgi:putative transposase
LLEALPEVFGKRREQDAKQQEELVEALYQQIGQLKVELDWLKKKRSYERGSLKRQAAEG